MLTILTHKIRNVITDNFHNFWPYSGFSNSVFDQIGDGWNVPYWLNMNFLKLVEMWVWILQNLRFLSCKSTSFVLVVEPTLMLLFWLFGLCLFGLLFGMYDSKNWVVHVIVAVWKRISLILGCFLCAWCSWNFLWHKS